MIAADGTTIHFENSTVINGNSTVIIVPGHIITNGTAVHDESAANIHATTHRFFTVVVYSMGDTAVALAIAENKFAAGISS